LTAFIEFVNRREGLRVSNYEELYEWSISAIEPFWRSIWDFASIVGDSGPPPFVENEKDMLGARWFPRARLNFAENLLKHESNQPALISWSEEGKREELSFNELRREVARVAGSLRRLGVKANDRVAGFVANVPAAVVAMLATTSLGAIWSSCSPEFGLQGILDRFGQIRPKVLFAVDGYQYAGKKIDCLERVRQLQKAIPALKGTILIPNLREESELDLLSDAELFGRLKSVSIDEDELFVRRPFDHPLYIMYSSGTTGLPKCMVHGAGGTLLQHSKELILHTDLKPQERILYFTTCGWMMWNWLVSSLSVGATVVLYDGSPFYPNDAVLFDLAEQERLNIVGVSAKYLALVEKKGVTPLRSHDLSQLKTILSTGSPLAPHSYDYVYQRVKKDVCLASISGGTDLISCFVLGNPIGPVFRGEIQARGLGMAVEVFNEQGKPVVGERGELVCTKPFPSMPVQFWNDPDGEIYREAYFNYFPGIWRHGDWAELTPSGGMIVHGRSDATLNPAGVRIGTAEIYRQVESMEEILESLAVGHPQGEDTEILLFIRLREGVEFTEDLIGRIKQQIRSGASPRHVPSRIIAVPDLPRTISGKISELAVRNILRGEAVTNRDALANPESLEFFRRYQAV